MKVWSKKGTPKLQNASMASLNSEHDKQWGGKKVYEIVYFKKNISSIANFMLHFILYLIFIGTNVFGNVCFQMNSQIQTCSIHA